MNKNVLSTDEAGQLNLAQSFSVPAGSPGKFNRPADAVFTTDRPAVVQNSSGAVPASSRVLLAAENSINRKVALQILRNLGYQVDAVNNGREAIESFRRADYAMVILSCQASEMTGYEAALEIRQLEGSRGHTPIIALTASTMQNDRKKREQAGMDDYISVPIDVDTVSTVLARWDSKASKPARAKLTTVDRNVIVGLFRLSGNDNPTLLNELIELFMGSSPQRLSELRRALDRDDPESLFKAAHKLKGSSGQMGAFRMQQMCAALETLGRAGTVQGAETLVVELAVEFDRVSQDLLAVADEVRGSWKEQSIQADADQASLAIPGCDISAIASVFQTKRLLALEIYPAVYSQLQTALAEIGCSLTRVTKSDLQDPGLFGNESLLFLGVRAGDTEILQHCIQMRQGGLDLQVIVIAAVANAGVLRLTEEMGADFVLEPFRVSDILLRAYLKLNFGRSSSTVAKPSRPAQLLVAEDDPLIARFLINTIESAGFRVVHVPDGEAALLALRDNTFQLVILDINMPKQDGYSVLSQLRLKPDYRSKPVLMVSARTQEHDIVRAFELGADDYVTKPFNPLEVVSRVRRLLRER